MTLPQPKKTDPGRKSLGRGSLTRRRILPISYVKLCRITRILLKQITGYWHKNVMHVKKYKHYLTVSYVKDLLFYDNKVIILFIYQEGMLHVRASLSREKVFNIMTHYPENQESTTPMPNDSMRRILCPSIAPSSRSSTSTSSSSTSSSSRFAPAHRARSQVVAQ